MFSQCNICRSLTDYSIKSVRSSCVKCLNKVITCENVWAGSDCDRRRQSLWTCCRSQTSMVTSTRPSWSQFCFSLETDVCLLPSWHLCLGELIVQDQDQGLQISNWCTDRAGESVCGLSCSGYWHVSQWLSGRGNTVTSQWFCSVLVSVARCQNILHTVCAWWRFYNLYIRMLYVSCLDQISLSSGGLLLPWKRGIHINGWMEMPRVLMKRKFWGKRQKRQEDEGGGETEERRHKGSEKRGEREEERRKRDFQSAGWED